MVVGITGGIGSGKSTVCALFEYFGVPVYNSDYWAKSLMVNSDEVILSIKSLLGDQSYNGDGTLNRKYISNLVFTDKILLKSLNNIVHPAVYNHFLLFAEEHQKNGAPYVVIESAILVDIGWHTRVDKLVVVRADKQLRVERVSERDGVSADEILMRIESQLNEETIDSYADYIIDNSDTELVIPRVLELHHRFLSM